MKFSYSMVMDYLKLYSNNLRADCDAFNVRGVTVEFPRNVRSYQLAKFVVLAAALLQI